MYFLPFLLLWNTDGLLKKRRNSIANAWDFPLFDIKPLIYYHSYWIVLWQDPTVIYLIDFTIRYKLQYIQ